MRCLHILHILRIDNSSIIECNNHCDRIIMVIDQSVFLDQVTHSRDTYQDLVRLMEQHRADRAVQLSILRYGQITA